MAAWFTGLRHLCQNPNLYTIAGDTPSTFHLPQAGPHTTDVLWNLETITQYERESAGCSKVSLEVGAHHDDVTQEVKRDAIAASEDQSDPREHGGLPGKHIKRALDNAG